MESQATPMTLDFSNAPDHRQHSSGRRQDAGDDLRPRTAEGKLLTPKQIRARARRKMARSERMSEQEFEALYRPVEEWDLEELAAGRPKNANGKFSGPKPKWISREVHERSMDLFKAAIKGKMNEATPMAIRTIEHLLLSDEVDDKGKPLVPASTKLDAAKFLLEHTVGKPTQRIESDISVRLQAILGTVMVNPTQALMPPDQGGEGYQVGHFPGITMEMAEADEVVDAEIMEDLDYGTV